MTSHRERKKQAARIGLSEPELRLAELCEELLEAVRWLAVLGYSNQYLVQQKLKVDAAERDRILEAATRAVERDARFQRWRERLARVKGEALAIKREINRAKKGIARGEELADG